MIRKYKNIIALLFSSLAVVCANVGYADGGVTIDVKAVELTGAPFEVALIEGSNTVLLTNTSEEAMVGEVEVEVTNGTYATASVLRVDEGFEIKIVAKSHPEEVTSFSDNITVSWKSLEGTTVSGTLAIEFNAYDFVVEQAKKATEEDLKEQVAIAFSNRASAKKLNEENIAAKAKIDERETALNTREATLNTRETGLNTKEVNLDTRETDLNTRELYLNTKETALNTEENNLSAREKSVAADLAMAKELNEDTTGKISEINIMNLSCGSVDRVVREVIKQEEQRACDTRVATETKEFNDKLTAADNRMAGLEAAAQEAQKCPGALEIATAALEASNKKYTDDMNKLKAYVNLDAILGKI